MLGGEDFEGLYRQRKQLCKVPEARISIEDIERPVVWHLEDV